jgi:hypothetical protein
MLGFLTTSSSYLELATIHFPPFDKGNFLIYQC